MLTLGASRQPITTGRMEDTGEVIPLPWWIRLQKQQSIWIRGDERP
jgi:hypothetical protein